MSQSRNPLVPLRVFLPYLLEEEMNKKGATWTFHSVFFQAPQKLRSFTSNHSTPLFTGICQIV